MHNLLISCFHQAHQKHGLLVYFFCILGQNKSRKVKIQANYLGLDLPRWGSMHQENTLEMGNQALVTLWNALILSPSQGKFTEDNNINEQLSVSLLFLGSCIFQTSIPSTILACIHIDKKTILMRFVTSINLGAKD